MFEIILIIILGGLVFFVQHFLVRLGIIVALILLIIPGVYAMLFGAPFVPSRRKSIDMIMKFGNFKKRDRVVELGSGDGRIIRRVAKKGVLSAVGYEFSFPTYAFSVLCKWGTRSKAKMRFKNFWKCDFRDVDVLICFLMKVSMAEFENKIWPYLKKGTRVVANAIPMPNVQCKDTQDGVYFYVKK